MEPEVTINYYKVMVIKVLFGLYYLLLPCFILRIS